MNVLSVFTRPHVIPDLYAVIFSVETNVENVKNKTKQQIKRINKNKYYIST